MIYRLFFPFLLAFFTSSAPAMSLREFRALEKSGTEGLNRANYYLVGVMEGALEGHAQASRGGAARWCTDGRKVEPSMARALYDLEIKRNRGVYEADMPVQLVMAQALIAVFPCP